MELMHIERRDFIVMTGATAVAAAFPGNALTADLWPLVSDL